MTCQDCERSLPLYLYDEVRGVERAVLEEHLASCGRCRKALEESQRLHEVLAQRAVIEPAPDLLAECRQGLEEALDGEQLGWRALLRAWLPPVATAHPARAMAALTLVAFGFSLGWLLRPGIRGVISRPGAGTAPAQMAGGDLGGARIDSISQVAPDPETGQVRITLNAERRVTMEGSLDDPHIRQVLVDTVKSYHNPGIRLDTLNALGPGSGDPAVLAAMLYVLANDQNSGMRLEALRTLRRAEWSSQVRQALVEAAQNDANPGVRDEAINSVVEHALSSQDQDVVPELRRLAREDSDRYVRLKSLAALHQMGQEPF